MIDDITKHIFHYIQDISTLRKGYIFNLHNREVFSVTLKRYWGPAYSMLHTINKIRNEFYTPCNYNDVQYSRRKYIADIYVYMEEFTYYYDSKLLKSYYRKDISYKGECYCEKTGNLLYKYLL